MSMPQTLLKDNLKTFTPWMAWVRLIAMLGVCICHACDPLSAFGQPSEKFWIEVYGSLVRPCVPLFVMLTGALLLPVEESFGGMWRKRCKRLILPFLLWTLIYATLPWMLALLHVPVETIQRVFFPFATPLHVDGGSVLRTFFLSLIQFNQYAVQLWYIYLLFGLYLFMPILSAWLKTATARAKSAFLLLWAASMLVFYWPLILHGCMQTTWGATFFADYVTRFGIGDHLAVAQSFDAYPILGACDWNTFGAFHAFSGFVGYLVLGHVLKDLQWSKVKTLTVCVPTFLVGYAIVGFGTHWIWNTEGVTWKMAEYFWWYCSIPVALMSASVFLLTKQFLNTPPTWMMRLLKHFSRVGFGVFCIHYVFVTGTYYLLSCVAPTLSSMIQVPVSAVCGLLVSWGITSLLYRIPKAQKVLG